MSKKESLRSYQDSILMKMEAARQTAAGQVELLFGFRAAGKNLLISSRDVTELTTPSTLEPIPVSKPWVVGAANVKGSVYTVTDFSMLMGGEPVRRGKFLLLSPDLVQGAALLIEGQTGLYELKALGPPAPADALNGMPKWVASCHDIASQAHYLIDAVLLAADPRFSKLQSGES